MEIKTRFIVQNRASITLEYRLSEGHRGFVFRLLRKAKRRETGSEEAVLFSKASASFSLFFQHPSTRAFQPHLKQQLSKKVSCYIHWAKDVLSEKFLITGLMEVCNV